MLQYCEKSLDLAALKVRTYLVMATTPGLGFDLEATKCAEPFNANVEIGIIDGCALSVILKTLIAMILEHSWSSAEGVLF